jgi:hypothetical protein
MTTAKEFIKKVQGHKIILVALINGSEDEDCGGCQFEFTTDDGYSFIG